MWDQKFLCSYTDHVRKCYIEGRPLPSPTSLAQSVLFFKQIISISTELRHNMCASERMTCALPLSDRCVSGL